MNFFGIESLRDLFTLYFEITHKSAVILHCAMPRRHEQTHKSAVILHGAWPRRHEQTHKSAVILQFIRSKHIN